MRRWMLVAGLAALSAVSPAALAGQTNQAVAVRAFRFFRAEGRQTLVTAFVEVPYDLLEAPSAANGELRYGVVVQITDANGTKLNEASWPGRARTDLRGRNASKLEILDFAVPPGKYHVGVAVTDSVSGRKFSSGADVEAWSEMPRASDLMLASRMRLATDSDSMPQLGERRWGNTLVTPSLQLKLTPARTKAFYLLEAYTEARDSGSMQVTVTDSAGTRLVASRPAAVALAPGGSVLKGQLDLGGLPPGTYQMTVELTTGSWKESRSESFVMGELEQAAEVAQGQQTDAAFFGAMSEADLDAAAAPLVYLTTSDSLRVWKSGLTVEGKRNFLTQFWAQRDPTPSTPKNELREQFYNLISVANRQYREGGNIASPGWKTDRGRVFVKYGRPADMLDRPTPSGKSPPYQVWRYASGRDTYYIFADRSGFGAYKLIATNNLRETQAPGFREILGSDALQDVSRWLGIDLFRNTGGQQDTQ